MSFLEMPQQTIIGASGHRPLLKNLAVALSLLICVGIAAATGQAYYVIPAAFVGAMLLVWFAYCPAAALFCMALQLLVLDHWKGTGVMPGFIAFLPDLVLASLALRLVAMLSVRRRNNHPPKMVLMAVLGLATLCVVSAVLNRSSFGETLLGLRAYLRWPVAFILLLLVGVGDRAMKWLVLTILAISLVQVPVTAIQYATNGGAGDLNVGTFVRSGSTELFMVCMFSLILLVALAIHLRKPLIGGLAALLMLLPPLFGFVRATIWVAPILLVSLCLYGFGLRSHGRRRGVVVRFAALAVLCAIVVLSVVPPVKAAVETSLASVSRFGGLVATESFQGQGAHGTGRITSLSQAHDLASKSLKNRLIGFGPGATLSTEYLTGTLSREASFVLRRTQVTATMLDLGYLGILSLVTVFIALFWSLPRLRQDSDHFWSAIGWAAPMLVSFAVCMLLYFPEWTAANSTPFVFWMLMAAPYVRQRETLLLNPTSLIRQRAPHWMVP